MGHVTGQFAKLLVFGYILILSPPPHFNHKNIFSVYYFGHTVRTLFSTHFRMCEKVYHAWRVSVNIVPHRSVQVKHCDNFRNVNKCK